MAFLVTSQAFRGQAGDSNGGRITGSQGCSGRVVEDSILGVIAAIMLAFVSRYTRRSFGVIAPGVRTP